jgi:RNA polymerase sigma factor (sigma-70 family)
MANLNKEYAGKLSSMQGYMRTIIKNKCGASSADIDEISQNVLLNLWEKREVFLEGLKEIKEPDLKKWVARFCHNHTVWYFSRKKKKDSKINFDSEIVGEEDHELKNYMKKESNSYRYKQYYSILSDKEKPIFELMWKGYILEQMAQVLGVTRQAINIHQHSIRRKINNHFKKNHELKINKGAKNLGKHLSTIKSFLDKNERGAKHIKPF